MSKYQKSDTLIIGLIGCGSVGVSFLYQLYKNKDNFNKIKIFIFDKALDARGYGYKVPNENLLLNAENDEMSIDPDNPDHFNAWLKSHNYKIHSLASRYIFGSYLNENFQQLLNKSFADFEINIIREEVTDCIPVDKTRVVIKANYHEIFVNTAILCHGAFHNVIYPEYQFHPCFIQDIYKQSEALKKINSNSKILLLGTGLGMLDASFLLKENNKEYSITATSHSGYFPEIVPHLSNHVKYPRIPLIEKNFKGLIKFINASLSVRLMRTYDILDEIKKYEKRISIFKNNINVHWENEIIYRFALELDKVIENIWPKLNSKDKLKAHKIEKYFLRFLSGIPADSFCRIKDFWEKSNYKATQFDSLVASGEGFSAKFLSEKENESFDYVINCTGLVGFYDQYNPSLLAKNILKNKHFLINEMHGLQVTRKSGNVYSAARPNRFYYNVLAVGEAKIGSSYMCCDYLYHVKEVSQIIETLSQFANKEIYLNTAIAKNADV
jgi:hypothetical protein